MPDRASLSAEDRVALAAELTAAAHILLAPAEGDSAANREYVRLFLSPEGAVCPPWQSVHQTGEGAAPRLLGPAHHSALAWFRRFGFEPALDQEPADHAGLLILFYARLLEQNEAPEILEEFASGHLVWLTAFGRKLAGAAAPGPLREVGEYLAEVPLNPAAP